MDQGFLVASFGRMDELENVLASPLKFDFIIMDRLLGSSDSKAFLPAIRKKWPLIPILILSAISTPNERTELLNLGADDYLSKPFSTQELVARVRALMRRTTAPVGNYIQVGNLIIDTLARVVSVGEKKETLPAREFTLLRTLASESDRVWSKDELLDYCWGATVAHESNVVEATVANVRKKLMDLGANVSVKNLRNSGYWLAH